MYTKTSTMAGEKTQQASSKAEENDNPRSLPKAETEKMATVDPPVKKAPRPGKR